MRKELSTKRLAVADRYTKRLLYLEKKGIDTSFIKNELKTIPGVSITNKGRISINKSMYSSNQDDILSALETWVPKSTKYKGSKSEKKATKVKKSKELEAELTKRADEISAKFGFDKEEFLRQKKGIRNEADMTAQQLVNIYRQLAVLGEGATKRYNEQLL